MEGAGEKTCEAFDKLSLKERQAIGVSAFTISPKSSPENKTRFISPLECILDEDGDTLFKIKESDVQIYMSIVNPQYEDGKRVSVPNGHRIDKLFESYDLEDLIVTNFFTFTSFKGLCGMNDENEKIMSHMNYYNNFVNNDFDKNGPFTKQIQTINSEDFTNDLCVDEREFSRDTYFMKQTTKNPVNSFLQGVGIQKLDVSATFQYDIMNTYGQNKMKNHTSNGYKAQDIMYFQDEYLDNSGVHTFYTRYQMTHQEIERASILAILGTIGGGFMLVFLVGTCSKNLILQNSLKKDLSKNIKGFDEESFSYETISKLACAQKKTIASQKEQIDAQEQRMKTLESQVAQIMKKQM